MKQRNLLIISLVIFVLFAVLCPNAFAKKRMIFGGGPTGGTFKVFANAIQTYRPVKQMDEFSIIAGSSAGSIENLRKTNSGRQAMSIVYASHVWLGRNGMMKNDPKKYDNVMAVAWLYGAPAQLVVRQGSGIRSVKDLVGKRVGVGNAGSGAFANCELFFSHMGVWNKIERNPMGYNDAARAFGNNQLHAFWLFTAFPSSAVVMAAQTNSIRLIDLNADAETYGYYKKYPFFGEITIPARTYSGVNYDVDTFQDSALWVANKNVPEDVVYKLLAVIYSDNGLRHIRAQKKTFRNMSLSTIGKNIVSPLHPGAEKFYAEKGVFGHLVKLQKDVTPPKIIITYLPRGIGIKKSVTIRGIVEDKSGVSEVIVDGKETYLNEAGEFSADVFLAVGNNTIVISAMDRHRNWAEKEIRLVRSASEPPSPIPSDSLRGWYSSQDALIVGINRYQNEEIDTLYNAVRDAQEIAKIFKNLGYEVIELYNEQATRKNILHNFSRIQRKSKTNDSFVFYFAGHGQGLTIGNRDKVGYIIPYDARLNLMESNVFVYDEEAIALNLLRRYSKSMDSKHVALLLDSCFSGLAMKRSIPAAKDPDMDYYNDLLSRKAINILTAGDDHPVSDGSGHSPFSIALINGLGKKSL
ncbi:MAG: TAXI family TRAP transporter solute-binding subunit, partial [Desulfobacterales bacterium]